MTTTSPLRLPRPRPRRASLLTPATVRRARCSRRLRRQRPRLAPYTETIPGTKVTFDMVPDPGRRLHHGQPGQRGRPSADEGPQVKVKVGAVLDGQVRGDLGRVRPLRVRQAPPPAAGENADRRPTPSSKPTPPYADETLGFGKGKQPALGMTWHAATEYCRWLSAKTGKTLSPADRGRVGVRRARRHDHAVVVRARRPSSLGDVAWYADNADDMPHPVGRRSPTRGACTTCTATSPSGCIDQYDAEALRDAAPPGRSRCSRRCCCPAAALSARRARRLVRGHAGQAAQRRAPRLRATSGAAAIRSCRRASGGTPTPIFVGFRVVRPVEETPALKDFASKITRAERGLRPSQRSAYPRSLST